MTTKTHTPGAIKAAKCISNMFGGLPSFEQRVIEIIDRETAAPEMLEALENFLRLVDEREWAGCDPAVYQKAVAAIQKARDGQ